MSSLSNLKSRITSHITASAGDPRAVLWPSEKRRVLGGLFVRKERWGLSWHGWLLLAVTGILAAYLVFLNLYPFLAVTHRVNANVLVVEGWVHKYAIEAAANEFKSGSYQRVFVTGGPVVGNGGYINDQQTSASVGADGLRKAGMQADLIQMVPSHVNERDRTYSSATALREWFREHEMIVHGFNVVTENTHARRTRLLFQKAFGPQVKVGVIAVANPDYDQRQWSRYSDGAESVLSEGIAYLYAKLFFWPSAAEPLEKGDGR